MTKNESSNASDDTDTNDSNPQLKNNLSSAMENVDTDDANTNIPGIWIGIDLGTTNSTAAFYSTSKSKAKLVRFRPPFAKKQSNDKHGRILPSAISFQKGRRSLLNSDGKKSSQSTRNGNGAGNGTGTPIPIAIGADALKRENTDHVNAKDDKNVDEKDTIVLSSVKRIWGMDADQVKNELEQDPTFLDGCPFHTILKEGRKDVMISIGDHDEDIDVDSNDENSNDDDGPSISPLYVVESLLRTIKEEATHYFHKGNELPVGFSSTNDIPQLRPVHHCILTVPAHFSRNRRDEIVKVAKKVGFNGHVSTMVESTAAAMAYGLFVGTNKKRRILVFDMGGGTTDVTIAQMIPTSHVRKDANTVADAVADADADTRPGRSGKTEPSFKVLGTLGERRLGGDDMDIRLAEYVSSELTKELKNPPSSSKAEWNHQLRMSCRDAKEKLCGDGKDELPVKSVKIDGGDKKKHSIEISQENFDDIVSPLVKKAELLVERALDACHCTIESIDEVILVGGATRTPSIRNMLQNKFSKKELCYSIDPYAAVAQGAAIQSAIVSGLVPRHELRNALMLDALPHPIGVLLPSESGKPQDERYVPILESGMELPAMNCASFRLADVKQKGVTIVAVEDIGEDLPLERLGEFTFLLHRLTEGSHLGKERIIDVGMTVETSGKFIVSIFDKNDPEHLKKKQRYQEWKRKQQQNVEGQESLSKTHIYPLDNGVQKQALGKEEVFLMIGCMAVFIFYVAIKMRFQEIEESSQIL